jgi:uncharacterized protein (TIGR00730 family)
VLSLWMNPQKKLPLPKPEDWPGRARHDVTLLEGAQGRFDDLISAFKIGLEALKGFWAFRKERNCVTVFGSARFPEDHPYYQLAREMGAELARAGYTVMTGGGPGVMEAANRGAQEAGGRSIGCNIVLPEEQAVNRFVDHSIELCYFFIRKVMLVKYSSAFVLMPGGFGTMDEIFETATLIQTQKIADFPIICMGLEYWQHLFPFVQESMITAGTISAEDLDVVFVTDSPVDGVAHITANTP